MTYDFDDNQDEMVGEIAPDTPLPKDLLEHLESRKKHRQEIINTTEKLTRFFIGWSLNSTGFFIAKFLLINGGSLYYWLAISLCFSISSVGSLAGLTGFRINYKEGLEVDNGQNVLKAVGGVAGAVGVTWLATKDYQYFENLTKETAAQINQDIATIEKQYPQLDPWLGIVIAALLLLGGFRLIFGGGDK
ncbi:MAG: hypothetical protein KME30_27280 [Iphinoe sp. HA4291-MV1]|jgi:hypothetical protein|nr:hypothetical protein [Iphinoe sp. HA4291-MV1]